MKLYKASIPKHGLSSAEQIFLVLFTGFLNEINMLDKYAMFTLNYSGNTELETELKMSQLFFIYRILSGKLNETWQMMEKNYFNQLFNQEYDKKLTETGKNSLKNIKRYFGKSNSINDIRNHLAFHYIPEKLKPEIDKINTFDMYFEKAGGNCYYKFSADIINQTMLELKSFNDNIMAFKELMEEINDEVYNCKLI